jgi:hypothetical protein
MGPPPGWTPTKSAEKDKKSAKAKKATADKVTGAAKSAEASKAKATQAAVAASAASATVTPQTAKALAPAAAAVPPTVTSSTAPAETKKKAASARALRRAALKKMKMDEIKSIAKGHGIEDLSSKTKADVIRHILNKEHKIVRPSRGGRKVQPLKLDAATLSTYGEDRLRKIAIKRSKGKGTAVPASLTKDQLIKLILATRAPKGGTVAAHKEVAKLLGPGATMTKERTTKEGKTVGGKRLTRYGLGPFRIIFSKGGKVIGDLGPYASARAATTDAKTLLRTAAPIENYKISQVAGQDMIATGNVGDLKGKAVDGYVVLGKLNTADPDLDAIVYQPDARAAAYAQQKIEKMIPAKGIGPLQLRANPKFRANRAAVKAKLAGLGLKRKLKAGSRRNGKVSFRTRDGRTVSFNAR